jgi:serine/threonine protein kinase
MNESPIACPKCGAGISADAPQGLCPKCLLQQASFPTAATSGARLRPDPPAIEALAAAFPHLEIVGLIGRGGMGFVFKARQPKLDRLVALKILAETLSADPSFAERFTREGRALARLNHPNIVTIHDFGQAGPFFYLLMEFVDGVNLRQAMQARQVTSAEALAIVPKICEALQYAHGEGILHRDIKPDNILLDGKGRVKIADFGIAKLLHETAGQSSLTGSGATLGTVHYMAPEQIEHPNEVDHRADIYSLGVVFYEMLTGELPIGRFPAPSEKNAVDPRLDKVVFKTLAKEPAKRQQTAGELGTEVQTISHSGGTGRAATGIKREPVVRASRCYISTPEHLRTWFGQLMIYTGRGDLRLEPEHLVWSHRGLSAITIPLAAITGLSVGEFPRITKPAGLNYIAATWQDGAQARRLFLVPNNGPFNLTWTTNQVVNDWFSAIQEQVSALTGRVPPSAPENTEPLPDSKTPPYRVAFVKAAGFALVFFMALFLFARLRRPRNPTNYPPSEVPTLALLTNASAAITVDSVEGTADHVGASSKTELQSDETVRAVISYNHGPWDSSERTLDTYSVQRDGTNLQFRSDFQWKLPQDFATPFDVSAEVQRVRTALLHRPLTLDPRSVLELFSIVNHAGQTVSGGLQYARTEAAAGSGGFAELSNFDGSVSNGALQGTFKAKIPSGYRLETFYAVNDKPKQGVVSWHEDDRFVTINCPLGYLSAHSVLGAPERLANAGTLHIQTNHPVEVFASTNIAPVADGRLRSFEPREIVMSTNVTRGFLQLVPIPISGHAAP